MTRLGTFAGVVTLLVAAPARPDTPARPDPHAWLLRLAGEYVTENAYSPAPGAPSRRSAGRATLTPVLDGRFLREESSTELAPGRTQGALKIWGYDSASARYQAAWSYTGSSAILYLSGEATADASAVAYEGEYVEPAGGRHTLRVELRPAGAGGFTLTLRSFAAGGAPLATLVTTYTRPAGPGAPGSGPGVGGAGAPPSSAARP